MNNYQLIYVKIRAINQRPLKQVVDETYEVLKPYHIFDRNIDDNCTINFNEMASDNARANVLMQRHKLSGLLSLNASDLRSETKGSRFEFGCHLCADVSCLQ